jgi:hypothetical protein
MNHIRLRTNRHGFSRGAVDSFLDFARAINLVLKTMAYKEPTVTDDAETPSFSATPEIKLMSWEEWNTTDSVDATKGHHFAIDVLIDEYWGRGGSNSSSFLQTGISNEAAARRGQQLNADSLPTRIRINSVPAKRLLGSILEVEDVWRWRTSAPVITRPFKILAAHSVEINDRMTEIERILAEKRKEQDVPEIAADEGLQPGNNSEGAPDHDVRSRQGDDDACSTVENANEDDISNVEAQSSRRSSFSKSMFGFKGTNLAESTCRLLRRLSATSAAW